MMRIPLGRPDVGGNEAAYVADALSRGQLSAGEYVSRFEAAFAQWCGVKYALACSSGTTALHLALLAVGVGPGDEVIVPALTYIATANAVTHCGAWPVFCDVDPVTWCLDVAQAARLVTPQTKAVVAVHLYGQPADMGALARLGASKGLTTVEDAAEAHGARYGDRWRMAGALSDVAAFSFYGNKLLTTGEGGMVTTQRRKVAQRVHLLRGQGTTGKTRYVHEAIGFNYRLGELAGAVGLAQMERADRAVVRRQEIFAAYQAGLGAGPFTWQGTTEDSRSVRWLPALALAEDAPVGRDALMAHLARRGIETRPVFPPLHQQPAYAGWCEGPRPVAERLGRQGICLPAYTGLTAAEIAEVCAAVREVWDG